METQPAARKPGSCVSHYSSSRESREGWTSRIWWEEGWTRASELPVGKVGACPFASLKLLQGEEKGKKGFYYICQIPQESLSGVQPQGSMVCQQLFCNMRCKDPTFKMGVPRGTENHFFFQFPLSVAISSCSLLPQSCGSDYSFGWTIWKMIMVSFIPR